MPSHLRADVLLVTVTAVEGLAVLALAKSNPDQDIQRHFIGNKTYHDLGLIRGARVFMVQSEMGSGGPSGSLLTVQESIATLTPSAVIMTGIAFGANEKKQRMGDVLISSQLMLYDLQRVGMDKDERLKIIPRGDRPQASTRLLDRFRSAIFSWKGANVQFGLMLSGDKLVDNQDFRHQLLEIENEAIGGEMEGAGLYAAAQRAKVDWVLVKAICDWADGQKHKNKKKRQEIAARNAAEFVMHVLHQGGLSQNKSYDDDSNQYAHAERSSSETDAHTQKLIGDSATRSRAFISYSHKDKEFAEYLYGHLSLNGVSVFLDDRSIKVGESIPQRIYEEIASSTHLIYVISEKSLESSWVQEELSVAKMKEKESRGFKILPVLLDDVKLPIAVAHIKYADFRYWQDTIAFRRAFVQVLDALDIRPHFTNSKEIQWYIKNATVIRTAAKVLEWASGRIRGGIDAYFGINESNIYAVYMPVKRVLWDSSTTDYLKTLLYESLQDVDENDAGLLYSLKQAIKKGEKYFDISLSVFHNNKQGRDRAAELEHYLSSVSYLLDALKDEFDTVLLNSVRTKDSG